MIFFNMTQKEVEKRIALPKIYKYFSVFLSMKCNLKCSYCLNEFDENFNRKRFMELSGEEWTNAINRIESRSEVPVTFGGGEPLLHRDFTYILNNLKPELNIDILTNLSYKKGVEKLLNEVDPNRIKRDSPYASIRVSYHPEQMGGGTELLENVKRLKDAGFSIGIWSVLYPGPKELSAMNHMQFRCRDLGIEFRIKDFTGKYEGVDDREISFSILHGDYSKYPDSIFQENTKECLCKTSELLIGPDGNVYRCHRDLYAEEFSIGKITEPDFQIKDIFRFCSKYGQCHPCDVKLKTNYKQELGHTSVEIKDIK